MQPRRDYEYICLYADGWKLLYKISKGINVDAVDAYATVPGQPFASQNLQELDASCGCYVKSQVVDNWSKFPITQVRKKKHFTRLVLASGSFRVVRNDRISSSLTSLP